LDKVPSVRPNLEKSRIIIVCKPEILGRINGALAVSSTTKEILVQHNITNIEFLPLRTDFSDEKYCENTNVSADSFVSITDI
jgi:hypothetical protein